MATKQNSKKTTKSATGNTPAVKRTATASAARSSKTRAKAKVTAATRTTAKQPVSHKVDYYPNRMTVAVSALAGSILVLLAVIAVLGSR